MLSNLLLLREILSEEGEHLFGDGLLLLVGDRRSRFRFFLFGKSWCLECFLQMLLEHIKSQRLPCLENDLLFEIILEEES